MGLQKIDSDLNIFMGKPEEIFERICDENTVILAQEEFGTEEREVQLKVKRWIRGKLQLVYGGSLLHPDDIPASCTTQLKGSFTSFRNKVEKKREIHVRDLYPYPKNLPPLTTSDLSEIEGYIPE